MNFIHLLVDLYIVCINVLKSTTPFSFALFVIHKLTVATVGVQYWI